ncbi:MAG: DUF169 domain-containing protein [Desulfomonilaceae bacterium]
MDTERLLNDVDFASDMLAKPKLSKADMVFTLRNLLKMKYYPVAVKYFFSNDELNQFKRNASYKTAVRPLTLCQFVAASRQRGDVLLGTPEMTGCHNAKYVMGWKELDESEIKSHLKYTKNLEQAERFIKTKERLPGNLLAYATAPLHKAPYAPDVVHGLCDILQSYHLAADWCAAFDTHPFQMVMTMNSSVCHGIAACHITQKPNITPMCSGSYTSGKTEQSETNWIWPGSQLEPTVRRTLERTVRDGGASLPRKGETYPGLNMCKLCPLLVWANPKD